ncbi:MAG: phosphomannomutase, partial [Candidatus Omnitrophota bacterium]
MDREDRIKQMGEKFKSLKFGTSGLRALVTEMTDMECYINTMGFISFLAERKELASGGKIAVAGDLRPSTPRIMTAVVQAIEDAGCEALICGRVPTSALAYYSMQYKNEDGTSAIPGIMVTGSHVPADRNGIKFTKRSGEVLKSDEEDILRNVAKARDVEYAKTLEESPFGENGMFKTSRTLPEAECETEAIDGYVMRYLEVFSKDTLQGKKIVLYQHSAVGRDILRIILLGLGAEVVDAGRSDEFIPVDTEKVSEATMALLRKFAQEHKPFAVVSTDGDSDRPLLADENGEFLPGDKLGALVSMFLKPDFAAIPISANDAVVSALGEMGVEVKQTKIGSPYVIKAMNDKLG